MSNPKGWVDDKNQWSLGKGCKITQDFNYKKWVNLWINIIYDKFKVGGNSGKQDLCQSQSWLEKKGSVKF